MNYYVPYFNMSPNVMTPMIGNTASKGIFSRLLGGLNWNSILNNTQKTLGIVNQAIPMVKQISPVMKNAKTMFKVMNEFKRIDIPISNTSNNTDNQNISSNNLKTKNTDINTDLVTSVNNEGPTFFIN